jgi:hypothetical protein
VPQEENPRANALAQQASGYNVRKRNFQEHKPLLTAECFALEAPIRPTQPTGLTGDTGLTDATERSNRPLRSGVVHGTGLTDGQVLMVDFGTPSYEFIVNICMYLIF